MSSPSPMSRPASPSSGISRDTPEQSPKTEPTATQQVLSAEVSSVVLSNDEDTDLQTILSKPFPLFDPNSIHKEYDDVAAKQTHFEEGAVTSLLESTRFRL